ncbi:MAG: PQQ-binding-like beta-propeller repeat protein, partial [Planctomycetes bacterium]|nr:PQQ-binding-like beta-propeller repeat protein [Planctomycetota bacterium]
LQADVGPSPVYADGVVYSANEFPGAAAIRVPADDATEAEIIWEADIGAPDCASPLVTDKFVLLLASYGTLTCYDAGEGVNPLWEEDFDDSSFTSSPTLAGSRVYLFGDEGLGYVVEPTADACKRISQTDLGEGCVTSPAMQDGRIYIRGAEHLFCIESESTEAPETDAPMTGDSTNVATAEDESELDGENAWPRFRGPGGLGVSAYTNLPTTWNGETGEGIRWKTAVPLPGNSSPVVWGKRVFLTGATEEERVVYCFDADSGEILWQTAAPTELDPAIEPPEVGETTGFAACTPATDGQRVYAMFANGDLVGIDYEGNVVWSRSLGVPDNIYGHAASLTMHENLLIVLFDQGNKDDGKSRLLGIDCETGETVWETVRAVPNSWTTPIVIQHEGKSQILTAADPWVIAYSPNDGKELWRVECLQADVGPSPVYADGVVYSANEFPGAAAIRVPADDATEAEIIWEADIGAPDCASPLVTDKFVLLLASYGTLTCYGAGEGVDPLWEEDFDDSSFTSSPTLAGSRVYLFGD